MKHGYLFLIVSIFFTIKFFTEERKLSIQAFYDEAKGFDSFMAHYGKFEVV